MRLRTRLMLFFGALLVVMAALVIGISQRQSWNNLLEESKARMEQPWFHRLEEDRLALLHVLASRIAENPTVNQSLNYLSGTGYLGRLTRTASREAVLARLRKATPENEAWLAGSFRPEAHRNDDEGALYESWGALSGLGRDLGPGFFVESGRALDLLILTDRAGKPLVELRSDPSGKPPEAETPLIEPVLGALQKDVDTVNDQRGTLVRHVIHTDGQLYLVRISSLGAGGALVVGTRLDQRWLDYFRQRVSLFQNAILAVGTRVIVPEESDAALGSALLAAALPDGKTTLVRLAGRDYLVTPNRISSDFDDAVAGATLARVYYLRSMAAVQDELRQMTNGIGALGLSTLMIALLGTYFLAGRVSRQIEGLAGKMTAVGDGDLTPFEQKPGSYEIALATRAFNSMVEQLRQKQMLAKMVPKQAREAIARQEGGRLEGKRIKTTILFSDIRGFTSLSERLTPTEVMQILDVYLARMTEVIEANDGDVNEYIGDAILADFEDRPEAAGALRAARAAWGMREALATLHATHPNPLLKELRQGIGLNTGEVVKGEIGASHRSKYALIGDTVNLAARIQDRSRDGRFSCILLSDSSSEEARSAFELELFGDLELKGKSQPARVWEIKEPR